MLNRPGARSALIRTCRGLASRSNGAMKRFTNPNSREDPHHPPRPRQHVRFDDEGGAGTTSGRNFRPPPPRPNDAHQPWRTNQNAPAFAAGQPRQHSGGRGQGRGQGRAGRHRTSVEDATSRGVAAREWHPSPPSVVDAREPGTSGQVPAPPPGEYRVMSYNLLADSHAWKYRNELYRGIPDFILRWPRRLRGVVQEVKALRPDVLCLQECEDFDGIAAELRGCGYEGLHAPRAGGRTDGCSLFYRSDAFRCEGFEAIDFTDFDLRENAAAVACLVPIGHGLHDPTPTPVVVGCVHLLFNPRRGDRKLGQLRVFIERVEAMRRSSRRGGVEPHAMLVGDFNAEPDSPLYGYIAHGRLDVSRVDRRDMSGCLVEGEHVSNNAADVGGGLSSTQEAAWADWEEEEGDDESVGETERIAVRLADNYWDLEGLALAFGDGDGDGEDGVEKTKSPSAMSKGTAKRGDARAIRAMMSALEGRPRAAEGTAREWDGRHRLTHAYAGNLQSCYREVCGAEPAMTSFHGKFRGTVDYIFHTPGIRSTRVLKPPRLRGGLPSEEYPSDHVSVVADVRL